MLEFHTRVCDRRGKILYNTCQQCGGGAYPTIFADPSEVDYRPGWIDDALLRVALDTLWHNVLTIVALAAANSEGFWHAASARARTQF